MDVTRRSEWGNPFRVTAKRSRSQALQEHRAWLLADLQMVRRVQRELRGRDLMCVCAPKACHADTLLEIANLDELV